MWDYSTFDSTHRLFMYKSLIRSFTEMIDLVHGRRLPVSPCLLTDLYNIYRTPNFIDIDFWLLFFSCFGDYLKIIWKVCRWYFISDQFDLRLAAITAGALIHMASRLGRYHMNIEYALLTLTIDGFWAIDNKFTFSYRTVDRKRSLTSVT